MPHAPAPRPASPSLRVAVTGGSGKVGRAVIQRLLERGHQVVNLDRRQADKPLTRFVYVDLTRREQVQPALEGMDAVCHLGEIPYPGGHTPEHIFAHNTAAGSIVFQIAVDLKIPRVAYASSIHVYGITNPHVARPLRMPLDESHPFNAQQSYGLSKVANEQYAQLVAKLNGLSVACFRLPMVADWEFGPKGESPHWDWFAKRLEGLEDLGSHVHATDAAEAFALALEKPRPGYEAYNLCAREAISIRPVRPWVRELFPELPALPEDWPTWRCPYLADKAHAHFGWVPKWNFLDFYRLKYGRDPQPQG
jgi:nucleoside-diphosphate-sugar epimerase